MSSSPELYAQALLGTTTYKGFNVVQNKDTDKLAIIIDPRYDDLTIAVIENFMYFMNPRGWNLMIIGWSGHADAIKTRFPNAIVSLIDEDRIIFDEGKPNITIDTYNSMLMDLDFWKSLTVEHICIFQRDCIMFKMFPEYYQCYDFCGASWHMSDVSLFNEGINGGFSIRKRSAMIDCLEYVSFETIEDYRIDARTNPSPIFKYINKDLLYIPLKRNEDVFFTYACEMLRKLVPDVIQRSFLAIEAIYNPDTCVYHGWQHSYHDLLMAQFLLQNSALFNPKKK